MTVSQTRRPIILYWDTLSGHSHRVRLFLSLLGLEAEIRQVQLKMGEHKQSAFLEKNPRGQLPAIEDGPIVLFDSNAILTYLALTYDPQRRWFPVEPVAAAEVVRHLSGAAGPLKFGAADARLVNVFGAKLDLERAQQIAHQHLGSLARELGSRPFLVGHAPTIADVAQYTYIAHAPEGGISLEGYPSLRAWLSRVEALPGFVPMERTAVGLQAA